MGSGVVEKEKSGQTKTAAAERKQKIKPSCRSLVFST